MRTKCSMSFDSSLISEMQKSPGRKNCGDYRLTHPAIVSPTGGAEQLEQKEVVLLFCFVLFCFCLKEISFLKFVLMS